MKLIDKEKLLEDLKSKRYSKQSLELIQSQPEVKAIPLTFISKYSRMDLRYNDYWAIIRLVEEYNKEYEKDTEPKEVNNG